MRLSDKDIKKYIEDGKIIIDPLPDYEKALGSASIDLSLGREFKMFKVMKDEKNKSDIIKINDDIENYMVNISLKENESFILPPNEFALGITHERIKLPNNIIGILDGRSSLARLGLSIHATAHTIEAGWDGKIVFEFANHGSKSIELTPFLRTGAISFELLTSDVEKPYSMKKNAKYINQNKVLSSKINKD